MSNDLRMLMSKKEETPITYMHLASYHCRRIYFLMLFSLTFSHEQYVTLDGKRVCYLRAHNMQLLNVEVYLLTFAVFQKKHKILF